MTVPLVLLAASAVMGVLSWRRSGGSMTRYRPRTGAPIVWLLLCVSSAVAAVAGRDGRADLASGLVTGGLAGAGLTLAVLVRRDLGADLGPDRPPRPARRDDETEDA